MGTRIKDLPAYAAPLSTDVMPVDDLVANVTKKVTMAQVAKLGTGSVSATFQLGTDTVGPIVKGAPAGAGPATIAARNPTDTGYVEMLVADPTTAQSAPTKSYTDTAITNAVAAAGAAGTVLYEVDFTGLATQDLRAGGVDADTNYTIDGKVWKIRNSSTMATTFALTNGAGLEWTIPNTVGAPGCCMRIPMATLLPTWDSSSGILELWIRCTQTWPQTIPGVGETKLSAVITSDPANLDWSVSKSQALAFVRNTNNLNAYAGSNPQGSAGGDPFNNANSMRQRLGTNALPSLAPYNDVICLRILDQGTVAGYSGLYSAGWPNRSTMQFLGTFRQDMFTNGTPVAYGVTAGSTSQLWLSMNNNVGEGAMSAKITHMRLITR